MIAAYAALGVAAFLLVLALRSTRAISAVSILHALAALLLSIYLLMQDSLPRYFLQNQYFFIDTLSLYAAMIASVITLLAAMYAAASYDAESLLKSKLLNWGNFKLFNASFNLLLTATMLAFFSNNLALFWIFAELTTLLSVILIAARNVKENMDAALKYIFIASAGMLFTFIGLILMFAISKQATGAGTLNWNLLMQSAASMPAALLGVSFGFVFIGFAAKSGIAPFHTWLPHAHSRSPSAISAILSGVVLNIGLYGLVRVFAIVHQTAAAALASKLLMVFGIFSIGVAALSMLRQTDLKKLIAFSSVENMSLMIASLGLGTPVAIFWMLFYMLGHSIAKALLFFSAGILHRQYESNDASGMTEAFKLQPLASWGLIAGAVAVAGMPPLALFLPKFSLLSQFGASSPFLLALVLALLLIAAVASISMISRIFTNVAGDGRVQHLRIPIGMKLPVIALILLVILIGVLMPLQLQHALTGMVSALGGG